MAFYAYLWLRADGTPYYAGKGTGKRAYIRGSHRLRPPEDQKRILIFQRHSEHEALETEKELIRNWGRKDLGTGCLRNFTDGGDGVSGLRLSVSVRQHMSQIKKGLHLSPATEFKIGQPSPRRGKIGPKLSAEQRRTLSELHRGHRSYCTPEGIEKMRLAKQGSRASDETRKRMSASGKAAWLKRKAQGIVQL